VLETERPLSTTLLNEAILSVIGERSF